MHDIVKTLLKTKVMKSLQLLRPDFQQLLAQVWILI
jgi:hypothetical protein